MLWLLVPFDFAVGKEEVFRIPTWTAFNVVIHGPYIEAIRGRKEDLNLRTGLFREELIGSSIGPRQEPIRKRLMKHNHTCTNPFPLQQRLTPPQARTAALCPSRQLLAAKPSSKTLSADFAI
jgi:hypothetical protein